MCTGRAAGDCGSACWVAWSWVPLGGHEGILCQTAPGALLNQRLVLASTVVVVVVVVVVVIVVRVV